MYTTYPMRLLGLIALLFCSLHLSAASDFRLEIRKEEGLSFAAHPPGHRIHFYQYKREVSRRYVVIATVNCHVTSDDGNVAGMLNLRLGEVSLAAARMGADAVIGGGPYIVAGYGADGGVNHVIAPMFFLRFVEPPAKDPRTEKDFLALLANRKLSPIEGLWIDEVSSNRVAIIPDPELIGSYIGILYHTPVPEFKGLVVMRFSEVSKGRYLASVISKDYSLFRDTISVGDEGVFTLVDRYDNNNARPVTFPPASAPNYTVSEFRFKRIALPEVVAPQVPRANPPPVAVPKPEPVVVYGSGLVCTVQGHLVTNHHVVSGAKSIQLVSIERGQIATSTQAFVLHADSINDIAILVAPKWLPPNSAPPFPPAIVPSTSAKLGDEVFVLGFPLPGTVSSNVKFTKGNISDLAGLGDDQSKIQHTAPIQPGNSGGPMCLSDGRVVGFVVSSLNPTSTFRETGALPQGVNFSVKSDVALARFAQLGIGWTPRVPEADSISHVKAYTVQIMVTK